jgi:hypothetical protein
VSPPGRVRAVCVRVGKKLYWRLEDGSMHEEVTVGHGVKASAKYYLPGFYFLCAKMPRKAGGKNGE